MSLWDPSLLEGATYWNTVSVGQDELRLTLYLPRWLSEQQSYSQKVLRWLQKYKTYPKHEP